MRGTSIVGSDRTEFGARIDDDTDSSGEPWEAPDCVEGGETPDTDCN
jgi:hypothetical protein